ncbi:unannotated protein [freshwater metagenome]|uniref:Unannotated protein n=1 Tax=freshwater metagenome TaxID=449393 RepID=A0A6J7NZJ4_9ZZZZ
MTDDPGHPSARRRVVDVVVVGHGLQGVTSVRHGAVAAIIEEMLS